MLIWRAKFTGGGVEKNTPRGSHSVKPPGRAGQGGSPKRPENLDCTGK